ncbi:PGF-pre-PGF domain-containing protein [Methanolobus psychrotolerans]|uniref:PGF-pre-PGF domain-containing protein n=1 Tax=Methanolobus psychrotolerans TaxID=1874706 RepID=UPI00101ADA9E|nr:PGF-pre-PGF domain-containing protein [Methanolobus psychrotolerans]
MNVLSKKTIVLIVMSLLLAISIVDAFPATSSERVLPASVNTGEVFNVTINVSDYGSFGMVNETIPSGFEFMGMVSEDNITVNETDPYYLFYFFSIDEFTYTLKAPSTAGTYSFDGYLHSSIMAVDINNTQLSVVSISTPSSSSSGGGGGGGGGATNEAYANIALKDAQSKYLKADVNANYTFGKEGNPIIGVEFMPLINTGSINVLIEVLYGTSSTVDIEAPGRVYKNVNLWVGKGGWASEDTIASPKVMFKVAKKWLNEEGIDSVNIRLARYTNKWTVLSPEIIGEDDDWVYFSVEVPGFSPFAITALQDKVEGNTIPVSNDGSENNDSELEIVENAIDASSSSTDEGSNSLPGFEILTAIALVSMVCFFKRRS